uniref:Uncharacterized protein n=1 Tax=Timema douglasi TaxID=61478 RepID=A0A7R8VJB3_TIMDO|nr:unnamed protein product [Timema douglasi]
MRRVGPVAVEWAVELNTTSVLANYATEAGEVVYDSIIKNKHLTKTYWEQLMMAAATSDQHKVQYLGGTKRDLHSLGSEGEDGKPLSDVSELEYFDARSHISTQSPSEQPDSFDQNQEEDHSVPKIVETVVKLLDGESKSGVLSVPVEDIYKNATESVIEREIRLQKEREDALIKEREEAFQRAAAASISQQQQQQQQQRSTPVVTQAAAKPSGVIKTSPPSEPSDSVFRSLTITPPSLVGTSSTPAETKIALEIREMREREEELRKLRQQILTSKDGTSLSTSLAEETLNSIPNTDEGNFSEYGSEEKELSLDGNRQSRSSLYSYPHDHWASDSGMSALYDAPLQHLLKVLGPTPAPP